jgi:hypothetical protein
MTLKHAYAVLSVVFPSVSVGRVTYALLREDVFIPIKKIDYATNA